MKPEVLDYEVLVKAKSFIEDIDKWCQFKSYRGPSFDEAYQFCAAGAIEKVMGRSNIHVPDLSGCGAWKLLTEAGYELYGKASPAYVNDRHGHWAVMKMFDLAIARAEAKVKGK